MVAACLNMSSLQKCPLRPLEYPHVFHSRRTSVQSGFREPLQQSARPIRYTTSNRRKSLFGFLPRKARQCRLSLTLYTNYSVFRRSIEDT